MAKLGLSAFTLLLGAWSLGCGPGSGAGAGPLPPLAGEARMTLLQTTDIHDHARDAGADDADRGSYARIAAYVEHVRTSAGHPVVLVDSGDWSMGTLYDLTLGRQPLPLWFADALRYDCITLGNHEFDYGPAGLAGILAAAQQGFNFRTPIVASNLELDGDPHLAPFLGARKPIRHTLVETLANGLRVGFLGLMGRDAASVAPAAAPVWFTDYSRDPGLVQGLVDDLRANQHCQIIIALDHAGTDATGAEGEDVDLARRVRGIDVIASGHMHNPLAAARTVANGSWNTLICCAGAFGTNVSRLDLVYRASPGATSLEAFENRPMTDASLAALGPKVTADPALGLVVAAADLELNRVLAPVFAQVPRPGDYDPEDPARGIYRPLGACAQDLRSNDGSAVLAPNGLGDFCADAFRAVPNGLLASIPLPPGADPTPFTAAVAATGELRGALDAGAAITFSELYSVMPLGLSPDPAQAGATGEPLVSVYMDPGGLREFCALQLLAQAGLTTSDFYLHLSGLSYELNAGETDTFFAMAQAAAAISVTRRKAGDPPEGRGGVGPGRRGPGGPGYPRVGPGPSPPGLGGQGQSLRRGHGLVGRSVPGPGQPDAAGPGGPGRGAGCGLGQHGARRPAHGPGSGRHRSGIGLFSAGSRLHRGRGSPGPRSLPGRHGSIRSSDDQCGPIPVRNPGFDLSVSPGRHWAVRRHPRGPPADPGQPDQPGSGRAAEGTEGLDRPPAVPDHSAVPGRALRRRLDLPRVFFHPRLPAVFFVRPRGPDPERRLPPGPGERPRRQDPGLDGGALKPSLEP